jgi:large subunit ribosomal protein L9
MQVILKDDVQNLGKGGDLVTVKPGYGRNYLIPQGLAMLATAGNLQRIEHEKKIIAARNLKLQKDAQAVADRLASLEIQIERAVGEADKLFGSVTSRDIEAALAEKGLQIDHKKFVLSEPIKVIGYHTVDMKLGQGITGKLKVVVVPKQS